MRLAISALLALAACGGSHTTYSSDPTSNHVADQLSGGWDLAISEVCPAPTPGRIDVATVIASPGVVNAGGTWSCGADYGPLAVTVSLKGSGWTAEADFYRTGAAAPPTWKASGDYAPTAMSGLVDLTGSGPATVWTARHR